MQMKLNAKDMSRAGQNPISRKLHSTQELRFNPRIGEGARASTRLLPRPHARPADHGVLEKFSRGNALWERDTAEFDRLIVELAKR
jgi:hypothetical protein